ncbi:hypothetical protein VX037_10915 [Gordonia sp. Z-3]|uniref:hypothetical protein n=1 Tax=Gordonia sp. Z-3 TaxID=3115408 RepID=UPI002E293FA5|nr:hypothetical protein [Gordonia sp. Z-3]MED5801537.1 hypothetical protein [Gordonia sp. Z-3]
MNRAGGPEASPVRRDLNGRPVEVGRLTRLRDRVLGRREVAAQVQVDDPSLVVVVESADDAVASSTALADSAWRADDEVVLRHVLRLPSSQVDDAVALAGLDGYQSAKVGPVDGLASDTGTADEVIVVLARVQLLDAMHLSQERSRMASLGSRHGGEVLRWQVLQPPVAGR